MANHQKIQREMERHAFAREAAVNPGDRVIYGLQTADGLQAILNMLGGGFEDSTTMEIVNPATGHFWQQNGISASGGTDDVRP